jgi:hypothetical protein
MALLCRFHKELHHVLQNYLVKRTVLHNFRYSLASGQREAEPLHLSFTADITGIKAHDGTVLC